MALLTPQPVTVTGLNPSYSAASGGGDTVRPGDKVFLHVKNGSGSAVTVTIVQAKPCNMSGSSPTHDRVVSVPASGERMIPTGPPAQFASQSTGLASITYSSATSVTVAAVQA